MQKTVLLYSILLLLASCSKREAINYEAPIFDNQKKLYVEVINAEFMFKNIEFIEVYDSLLIVCDASINPMVHIFNKESGVHILSTGERGKGPNELISPIGFSLDRKNGYLYVFDDGRRNVITQINVDSMIYHRKMTSKNVALNTNNFQYFCNNVTHLKDSMLIYRNGKEGFGLGTKNNIVDKVQPATPYPFKSNDWLYFFGGHSLLSTNQKGNKLVLGTTIGGIMSIYNIDDNAINLETTRYFYEPIFGRDNVIFDFNESIFGFYNIYLSDNFIYSILFGEIRPIDVPQYVCKFDYEGNPITRYDIGYRTLKVAVDEDENWMYLVILKDNELALARANLNQ